MTSVSYCDNTNCLYNKEYKCFSKEGITLDESASCITASYETDKKGKPKKGLEEKETEKKESQENLEIFRKKNEDWFKVI